MPTTYADRGGTFTDVVVVDDLGAASVRKLPSDRAVLGDLAEGRLVFGTTVATNAVLTGNTVPVLLIVAEGLADLPRIGDMTRPALFDPDEAPRPPLWTRIVAVRGRLDARGVEVEPLILPPAWPLDGIAAVAIALPHSGRNPAHEQAVAAAVLAERPDLYVSMGHRLAPGVGLLARIETALLDAAVTPVLRHAMTADRIPDDALALRSDGTLVQAAQLLAPDALLSGPAAGARALAAIARRGGGRAVIGLDMGGTSTDVVVLGSPEELPLAGEERRVAGLRNRRPALRIETIAAGGGSVVALHGRTLTVGPTSAGADPGPQCTGRGGPPTVTDAALSLGLVDADAFVPPLRVGLVKLPCSAGEAVDLCREQMAAAVRRAAAEGGHDPADFALVAFGGAAGQHAADVAARLGIAEVWVHPAASVLSAWGLAQARREESASGPIWATLPAAWPDLVDAWERLTAALPPLGPPRRLAACRILGTDRTLVVAGSDAEALQRAFREAHRAATGTHQAGLVEVVDAIVRVSEPAGADPILPDDPWGLGEAVREGPALLRCPTTSVYVPTGWTARRRDGLLVLSGPQRDPAAASEITPHTLAVWSSRFEAVAEEAGAALVRLARSVNIRERRDFSCAVFDEGGRLVAHAPHVPVHLGAMGETVRDLLRTVPSPPDGVSWLCNHPGAGGSHLPDLTVTTAVYHQGRRWFVACRGHHVDVGGITPGSMPPRATRLEEEGVAVRHLRLDGPLDPLLGAVRDPDTVAADLDAQVQANRVAASRLRALGPASNTSFWMAALRRAARDSVADWMGDHDGLEGSARDDVDGVPLAVRVRVTGGRLRVDFGGTGGPHPGNLNAPRAVTRAALLYALRVAIGRPFPLNEGALDDVDLVVPAPSLLDPPDGAAVAGGNVETSQRIADLLLGLLTGRAAGQGTMNNLTLGGAGWSFYETVGGGQGASPKGAGLSGLQVHLTNTRATDVEVLEHRLPLRVVRFALRDGSGGRGRHAGGDGLVRELALLAPGTAALLAARRPPPGAAGGEAGSVGQDAVLQNGRWLPWDGAPVALQAGDRVRVETPGGGGYGAVIDP